MPADVEFTTMAGRRLRDAVKDVLIQEGNGEFNSNIHVVIAGLSNTYSQYVTTFEEYKIQRYEVVQFCSIWLVSLEIISSMLPQQNKKIISTWQASHMPFQNIRNIT
jgi:Neutral/alkaline non-lysosomal ceramidase, N-terminal